MHQNKKYIDQLRRMGGVEKHRFCVERKISVEVLCWWGAQCSKGAIDGDEHGIDVSITEAGRVIVSHVKDVAEVACDLQCLLLDDVARPV